MLVLILIPIQIKIKAENMAGRPGLRVRVEITLRKTYRSQTKDLEKSEK
jgi:hypothetical protein